MKIKLSVPGSKKGNEPPGMLEGQNQKRRKMDCGVKQQCGRNLKTMIIDPAGTKITGDSKKAKGSLDEKAAKMEPAKVTQNGRRPLVLKVPLKGTDKGNRTYYRSAEIKPQMSAVVSNCESASASSCESLFGRDHGISKKDSEMKGKPTSGMSKYEWDSDGDVSILDAKHFLSSPRNTIPATTASSGEECSLLKDVQLSPKKALRALMLKSRFADTILRAKQKTLLYNCKVDPVKIQQEKERFERQQLEEKAKIEAEIRAADLLIVKRKEIRAAEAASCLRAEAELKMQRERERQAARIALHKMEKNVEFDSNMEILKELEMLCKCSMADNYFDIEYGSKERCGKPLECLGLFLKDDYMDEENLHDLSPERSFGRHLGISKRDSVMMGKPTSNMSKNDGESDEKAKIEEQIRAADLPIKKRKEIRAAEAAPYLRAEAESKMQWEREREAARTKLQKMEKTVEIDSNLEALKELQMLCKFSTADDYFDPEYGSNGLFTQPLEHLRLFPKGDFIGYENEANLHDNERSFVRHHGIPKRDSRMKGKPTYSLRKYDREFDEHFVSSPRFSTPATIVASGEEVQRSRKTLRAAMLKIRFTDTILKEKQKTLLDNCKADPVKMQQEKERLERQQLEEKAMLEAQIRAAEAESKMQREREREGSRIALEKMKKTVDIYGDMEILKDFEAILHGDV